MLRFENVVKTYRLGAQRVEALRGLNLSIEDAGFFAVMGPSGSGKSTLLHLAAGLDQPDSGRVVAADSDLTEMSQGALTRFRRERVGIVFQQFNLMPTLSARENIELPGVIAGKGKKWREARAAKLLEELGLTARADHRPAALSGGEQQRVAIARALFFEPKLLLADEPTGSLDSASSENLWRMLGELAERHAITIFMVTHEPAAAVHCKRVYVLGDGTCRGDFEIEGLDASGVATRYWEHCR